MSSDISLLFIRSHAWLANWNSIAFPKLHLVTSFPQLAYRFIVSFLYVVSMQLLFAQ